jgi:hypothetical protein
MLPFKYLTTRDVADVADILGYGEQAAIKKDREPSRCAARILLKMVG